MLLVPAAVSSVRFDGGSHVTLLAECDSVSLFSECGWANAAGYVGSNLRIHVHADTMQGLEDAFADAGYVFDGSSLQEMEEEAKAEHRRKRSDAYLGYGRRR